MNCPKCGLLNPPSAQRCDCGYDFMAKRVKESYLARDAARRSQTGASGLRQHLSTRILIRLAGATVVVAVGAWRACERNDAADAVGEMLRQEAYRSYSVNTGGARRHPRLRRPIARYVPA